MKYKLISAEQFTVGDKPQLVLFGRGEDGKKYMFRKSDLESYFYSAKNPEEIPGWIWQTKDIVKKVTKEGKSIFGNEVWKIVTNLPKDTYLARKGLPHNEADIVWTNRCLIDMGITSGFTFDRKTRCFAPADGTDIPYRTWVIDIEVANDPKTKFPSWKDPQWPIVCIVVWDSVTNQTVKFSMKNMSEIDMYGQFIRLLHEQDPDILTGWNVYFDASYLIGRMEHTGFKSSSLSPIKKAYAFEKRGLDGKPMHEVIEIAGRIIFDALDAYKVYKNPSGQKNSYNLKAIAKEELGVEWEDYGARVKELWAKDPDLIIDYCEKDVLYERDVILRNSLIEIYGGIAAVSGCPLKHATKKGQITDNYLLRISEDVLPSKHREMNTRTKEEAKGTEREFKGAIVLSPPRGVHEQVAVFDASGLYPSIMIAFNISLETKIKDGQVIPEDAMRIEDERGNKWAFINPKYREGLVPRICKDFKKLRKASKARLRDMKEKYGPETPEWYLAHYNDVAIKTVMNGIYGTVGEPGFRLFDLDCANAITAIGRKLTTILAEKLTEHGWETVYGDTDSVFVKTGSYNEALKAQKYIIGFMKKQLVEWGLEEDAIEIGFEKFFKSILFKRKKVRKGVYETVKKKYVGHMINYEGKECDELYIRGFETRRSDQANILTKVMMEFFVLMFQKSDIPGAIDLIKKQHKEFEQYEPYEIAVPRTVHKYVESSPWVRGMEYGKKHLGWEYDEETAPRLLYIKRVGGGKYPQTDAICIQKDHDLPIQFEIDYKKMFDRVFRKKMEFIMEELGYKWIHAIEGVQKMDAFF